MSQLIRVYSFKRTIGVRILLLSLLLLGYAPGAIAQPLSGISISPTEVRTGGSALVELRASGFFDLSEVTSTQIAIRPADGVSNIRIVSGTAQRMSVRFDLSDEAAPGIRTFLIRGRDGTTRIALDLTLVLGRHICRPACTPPNVCSDNRCKPPEQICTVDCGCEDCQGNRCVPKRCTQRCDSNAIPPEICECGMCIPAR